MKKVDEEDRNKKIEADLMNEGPCCKARGAHLTITDHRPDKFSQFVITICKMINAK